MPMMVRHDGAKECSCIELLLSSLAAREMRVGLSDPDYRIRVQTTGSCFGPMTEVVSVSEKARRDLVR
jgi:hypothetical protein